MTWSQSGCSGQSYRVGTVVSFIPGQNQEPAAVVRLDKPMIHGAISGDILILELRYSGSTWLDHGTVHVEFCDFLPEPRSWRERRQGVWVESNATFDDEIKTDD
jgi:hypothetical protein